MGLTNTPNQLVSVPVSVVIPFYHHELVIERAIKSVVTQTIRPLELIVINDGCTGEIFDILNVLQEKYGADWLIVIHLSRNLGAGVARNAGWNKARGDYIAFLDADDAWHPNKLEIQYSFMKSHADVVVCGHRHRQENSLVNWGNYALNESFINLNFRSILFSNKFITPSVMIFRMIDERFTDSQRHMEDFRLWLTIAQRGGRIVRLDAELACIFKPIFGESGLSSNLVFMELAELQTYLAVCKSNLLTLPLVFFLFPLSIIKFIRRLLIVLWVKFRESL
jgi:glycosyltransferase involved in cell wall biosynthesis